MDVNIMRERFSFAAHMLLNVATRTFMRILSWLNGSTACSAEIVRVIVRERGTKPSETSLKLFASRVDFIGSRCTACVGV